MTKQVQNQFSSYEFDSPEEAHYSNILTEANLAKIRNMLSFASLQRANLDYDVTNPYQVIQTEAALKGQILICQSLIDDHNSAINSRT